MGPMKELNEAEAKDVLAQLQRRGVEIKLDGESQKIVSRAIETFLNRYKQSYWSSLTRDITSAIRREVLKSRRLIDAKLVTEVVEHLKKQKEANQKEGSRDEEEDSNTGSEEEESESDSDDSEDDEGKKEVAAAKEEEIDELKDSKTRSLCIHHLLFVAGKEGMSVKKGDEEEILEMMIPYIRRSLSYILSIQNFLKRVRKHIDRCGTLDSLALDSLETVENALQDQIFSIKYEDYKVKTGEEDMADANKDQLSKKNMLSTKEEGIATPLNQIKHDEIRECGDIMEIEEKETLMIPLNLPEQPKECTGNAYSCIKESLERAGSNKRKLAQV